MADNEPCSPWDIDTSCCPNWLPSDTEVPDPDTENVAVRLAAQAYARTWASNFLWKRSRRRIGVCDTIVYVCPDRCHCNPCICGPSHIIELSPDLPVISIAQIKNVCTDTVIADDRYMIVDGRGVGLVDGTCGWLPDQPFDCQLSIAYVVGQVPDTEALAAGGALACAFVDACIGANCKQGDFLKMTAGFFKRGKRNLVLTGIPLVDHWLIEVNRGGSSGMLDPSEPMTYSLS